MRKGFTLIELLVVIAIIAILAAIAIPQYNKYRANAMLSNVQNFAKSLAKHASALVTTAAQNPQCASETEFTLSFNDTDSSLEATNSTGYVCDKVNIVLPKWVEEVDANGTLSVNATKVDATGTIEVKSTYTFGSKHFGCKYNLNNDTLEDIDTTYVCSTTGI